MNFIWWTNMCCALLIASSDGRILRLPCKVVAEFKIIHLGKRLLDQVLMSFNGLQDTECMVKCVENEKCRSYNTNKKDGRCEINGKALADSGAILGTDSNWVYKSTDYSSNLIGPVCTSLKPCGDKILCKDSCDPPYYKCVYCDADHEGLHCDVAIDRNECSSNPCQNSGTCVDKIADYQCTCLNGFTGKNCEIDIDECMSLPCFNGGSCINEIGNYTCNCTTAIGYTGRNCEIDIDECISSPCLDGGSCINEYGSYTCNCPSAIGHVGKNCEKGQFVIYKEFLPWANARQKCVDRGGDLASIGTAAELGILSDLFATSTEDMWIWVGLNDEATDNEFVWSDGTTSVFPPWHDNEPGGGRGENCAFIKSQSKDLYDAACSMGIYYLCKFR